MADLYNHLETVPHTLTQFINRATSLFVPQTGNGPFNRFVLTGEYFDVDNEPKQAFLDPLQNRVDPGDPLVASRDYDSIIGIADTILVDGRIQLYSVPHPSFALKTSVHIKESVNHDGVAASVNLNKIPNFELGTFGERSQLYVFFPKLWSPSRSKEKKPYSMTFEERSLWYTHGLRPAVERLLGERIVSEYPATVETEEIRARKHRGGYAFGTKLIAAHAVPHLTTAIRDALESDATIEDDAREWATSFLIVHTIRGTKQASFHAPTAADAAWYLQVYLREVGLSENIWTTGRWYIDVAIEITSSARQSCLQWLTSTHHIIAQEALRIPRHEAVKLMAPGSSKTSIDYASHLTEVAGFRSTPGPRAQGVYEAVYLQAYTTDKSVLYLAEGGHHAKFLTVKEAMGPKQPHPIIEGIENIYREAVKVQSSNLRLEIRVPLAHASSALVEFDPTRIRQCICAFSREAWWGFRITRLSAINQTLMLQASGLSEYRVDPSALALTAACVWLLNGLHARPEDGPAARRLMDVALPITEAHDANLATVAYRTSLLPRVRRRNGRYADDGNEDVDHTDDEAAAEEDRGEDDDETAHSRVRGVIPYIPYGCVFFRRIQLRDVPRFRIGGQTLPATAFKYWFSGMTYEDVQARYITSLIIHKDTIAAKRFTTNKRKIPLYIPKPTEPDLFHVAADDEMAHPRIVDEGSDREEEDIDEGREGTQNEEITKIFRQFIVDLTSKSPNPHGSANPSYMKLNDEQRRSGSESPYLDATLANTFNAFAYKVGTIGEWRRAFEWLFPERGTRVTSRNVQNYPRCNYYTMWLRFANDERNSQDRVANVRDAFWQRIRKWAWIPDAQQDRMWMTTLNSSWTRVPPQIGAGGRLKPAPRILLREQRALELQVRVEEEEESGSDSEH